MERERERFWIWAALQKESVDPAGGITSSPIPVDLAPPMLMQKILEKTLQCEKLIQSPSLQQHHHLIQKQPIFAGSATGKFYVCVSIVSQQGKVVGLPNQVRAGEGTTGEQGREGCRNGEAALSEYGNTEGARGGPAVRVNADTEGDGVAGTCAGGEEGHGAEGAESRDKRVEVRKKELAGDAAS